MQRLYDTVLKGADTVLDSASNVIPAIHFGREGPAIRVCNDCYSIHERTQTPTEGPPSTSSKKFRPGLRNGSAVTISSPLEASARPPQANFSASSLFPSRSETPFTLPSEYGGAVHASGGSSRGQTPFSDVDEGDSRSTSPRLRRSSLVEEVTSAKVSHVLPFRRTIEEEKDVTLQTSSIDGLGITSHEQIGNEDLVKLSTPLPPPDHRAPHRLSMIEEQTVTLPTLAEAMISPLAVIAKLSPFPTMSPPTLSHERAGSGMSNGLKESATIHSQLQHLPELPIDPFQLLYDNAEEAHVDSEKTLPLSPAATKHVTLMLNQTLSAAKVPHAKIWEKVLLDLLLNIAQFPVPDLQAGDSIDVRQYVRVKKVPGGRPKDSEYVDGVVFTKNLLHKAMSRKVDNPRIMLLSMAIEARHDHGLTIFDELVKSEPPYIHNLCQRISASRPHIVLVEKNVSMLALDLLMSHGIAVARNVKKEAIAAIARSTQADVISSMSELAQDRKLGRCKTFRVQTFAHTLIPGKKKTFIRIEGCLKRLGCTLLLRGGDMKTLTKVKEIAELLVMVIYNARLEGHLMRDELVLPSKEDLSLSFTSIKDDNKDRILSNLGTQDRKRISQEIAQALKPYETTVLSGSVGVKFPPPYPLVRMNEIDRKLTALRLLKEYEETEQILSEELASRKVLSGSNSVSSLVELADGVKSGLISPAGERSRANSITSSVAPTLLEKQLSTKPVEDPIKVLQTPQELAKVTDFAKVEQQHAECYSLWESYLLHSKDSFNPIDHQKLFVLETKFSNTGKHNICSVPSVKSIDFYSQDDESVGQLIERISKDAGKVCKINGCSAVEINHFRTFVQGDWRLTLSCEYHQVPLNRAELEGQIVMQTICKTCLQIRNSFEKDSLEYENWYQTAMAEQTIMSEETTRMSFAKYLELSFYSEEGLIRNDGKCIHQGRQEMLRFWYWKGISTRISMDRIEVKSVLLPHRTVQINPVEQLVIRNEEFVTVLKKSNAFFDSIMNRINHFNYDVVQSDRVEESRLALAELSLKCETDRKTIHRLLTTTYEHTPSSNGTEMTSVRRALQHKAVEWETEWTTLEQKIVPSEKDVRRLTTIQLKKLFSNEGLPLSPERRSNAPSISSAASTLGTMDEKAEVSVVMEEGEEVKEKLTEEPQGLMITTDSAEAVSSPLETTLEDQPPVSASTSPLVSPSSPITPRIPSQDSNSITDNESDSTVRDEVETPHKSAHRQLPSPYAVRRQTNQTDTSGAEESESERRRGGATPLARRHSKASPAIAHLVSYFSEKSNKTMRDEGSSEMVRTPSAGSSSALKGSDFVNSPTPRPALRRGVSEKIKAKFRGRSKDILSDGDGSSGCKCYRLFILCHDLT